jgi:hypothetical protein
MNSRNSSTCCPLEGYGNCPQLGSWPIGEVDRTAEELSRRLAALAALPLEVIAPSEYFLRVIRSSPVGQGWTVHHIPNGIDAIRFKPARGGSGRLRILVVNRNYQHPHKGFAMVRQALKAPADLRELGLRTRREVIESLAKIR